ncbi:DUF6639 family protein [Thioclava nitratireducens]|uniref:DUF6639 family protein n=1 Tax=Thioclava nitratireducens TaxID=1915078 RepID=UPI0012FD7F95|nr:DUF6639 family protein [Thioclava nitratireducens]
MYRSVGLIAGLLVATASIAGAENTLCQTAALTVEGGTPVARDRICRIAAREIPKLAACNVMVPEGLTIRFDETLPEDCIGLFHCGEAFVRLLPPDLMAESRKPERAFSGVPDDLYFDSVVVHELTHAAYDKVECPFSDCSATAEYAAYAMQVRSMPIAGREAFEAAAVVDHRITREELNATYYTLSPDRFAQKAWLHFIQREDGCDHMGQIMGGAVFFDEEPF